MRIPRMGNMSKCEWDLENTRPYFFLTKAVLFPHYFLAILALFPNHYSLTPPALFPHYSLARLALFPNYFPSFHPRNISSLHPHFFLTRRVLFPLSVYSIAYAPRRCDLSFAVTLDTNPRMVCRL